MSSLPAGLTRWFGRGLNLPVALALAAFAVYGAGFADGYGLRILAIAGAYALLAIGYQFAFGHSGALSLAQGTFFGVGAYTTALLAIRLDWGFLATFPASVSGAVVLALLVAAPVLRLRSHYLALATLGISQVVLLAAIEWTSLTGGSNGLPGVPGIRVFGVTLASEGWLALAVWVFAGLGALAAGRFFAGLVRARFAVVRGDEIAAGAAGIDARGARLAGFALSAAFGGAAGALFVHVMAIASPESLEFGVMVTCLSIVVIGGRTRLAGAVLAALILIHLPEWFRFLERHALLAYGIGLLAMIVLAPDGLIDAAERLFGRAGRVRRNAEDSVTPADPRPRTLGDSGAPVLRADGISKRFGGNRVLEGVDIAVASGEIVGIIGPNGSGKTTLLNILTGLYEADTGDVRLRGAAISGMPAWRIARMGVGRGHQTPALPEALDALDIVATAVDRSPLFAPGRARTANDARARAHAILAFVGLSDLVHALPSDLAQHQRRRLELARALALDPDVILMDEPAAGLTERERTDLATLFRGLRGRGFGLVIVDHSVPFLAPLTDRLYCLDAGRVIASGPAADVIRDPAVVEAYLGPGAESPA